MTVDRNCLDAETVAAWLDGGLDTAAAAAAEAHASTCERCQALLATVVKTLPAEPAAVPAATRLWQWWLAPLAATAAAVTLWMVVPQEPMQRAAAPPAVSTPTQEQPADLQRGREQAAADARFAPVVPTAPAVGRDTSKDQRAAEPDAPAATTLEDARRNVPAQANEANRLAAAGDTAKADADAAKRLDPAKREEGKLAAEMRQAAEAPAPAAPEPAGRFRESAPAPAPSAAAAAASGVTQLRKQTALPVIVSPDVNSQWRALTPGTVERSEDGGRTWIAVRVAANEEVLGGASPARLVCWLVGKSGLVLLATDGTNFTRLPFPASVDLVSISSPEARIAIVTTADGRTFRTDDGGRTWRIL